MKQILIILFFFLISICDKFIFAQCNFTVNAGPDIKVCNTGDMTNMAGKVTGIVREIYWEPPSGLQDPKNPTTKITVNAPGEYILVAKGNSGINLITNGDFEQGKTAFGTDYVVGTMSCYGAGYLDCEGTYDVINNPQLGHTGFAACKDHTSGGGLMMVLNGAPAFQNVWCQTVPVMPNMDYILTIWVTSVVASSPPIIQANINGMNVGPPFFSSGSVCAWEKHEVIWNSGSSTSADICFLNENTNTGGNDFAIDDISFVKICEKRDTMLVEIEEINIVIEDPGIVNCDRPQLRIDASGSSQGKNFTFKWNTPNGKIISGENTLMPTIEGPGTYELTICSPLPNCCKKTFIEIQGSIKKPDLNLSVLDSIGCTNDSVIIYSSSSVNPLDYLWEGPNGYMSDDQNAIVKNGGTYTVTIIDEYNCKTTKSITVFENADNPKISIKSNHINCALDTAFIKGNTTVNGSLIEWFGPNGFYTKSDSFLTVDSGIYKIKVTTPNNCIRIDSVIIKKDINKPNLSYTANTINCKQDSSEISIQSNLLLEKSAWNTNHNYLQYSDLKIKTASPGIYTFKGVAENGCIDSLTIEIKADTAKPYLNPFLDTINCLKTSIKLISGRKDTASQIHWTGPNGFNSNQDGDSVSIPGRYNLTVTSSNFCSAAKDVEIAIDTLHPDIRTKNDTLNCKEDKINLFLADNFNSIYEWKGPNGFVSNEKNPLVDKPGLYVISAKLPNGCITSYSVALFELKDKPLISSKNDTLNCLRDSLQLNASTNDPMSSYEWSGPSNFQSQVLTPIVKNAGSYKLIVTNSLGCKDSTLVQISQDVRKPDLTSFNDTINCNKTRASLKAISSRDSLIYNWTGPNGFTSTDSIINVQQGGQYKIKVITPEFCSSEYTVLVQVDTIKPKISINTDTLNCKITSINLSPQIVSSGNDNYLWTGPLGFSSTQKDPNIKVPGQYILNVTSSNFCSDLALIQVVQDTIRPIISLVGDTLDCNNVSVDLIADIIPSSLSGEWNLPDNSKIIGKVLKINRSGNYRFSVTGNNFCTNEAAIVIVSDSIPPDLTATSDSINCKKINATIDAISLSTNVRYNWTGPGTYSSSQAKNNVTIPGIYIVNAIGKNGCSNSKSVLVAIDTSGPLVDLKADTIDCKKSISIVQASIDINNPTVIWKNSVNDSIGNQNRITVSKSGTYSIEVTNPGNHCKVIKFVNVIEDSLRIIDVEIKTKNILCNEKYGNIASVTVTGGNGNLVFALGPGRDSLIANIEGASFIPGRYTLFILDSKNCEFKKDFEITSIPSVNSDIGPDIELKLGESKTIDLSILSDPALVKTIEWNPPTYLSCTDCEDPIASPPVDFEYEVTITDTNGCKSIERIKINVEDPEVWLPNVFSPNGDGVNDWFYPVGSNPDVSMVNIFQIYDRWGELIYSNSGFRPNDERKGWNGFNREQQCNPGVYVYWMEVELVNGKKYTYKGDLTLIK